MTDNGGAMNISFGDDAFDLFVETVSNIPVGYTVAILNDGEELPSGPDLSPGVDVKFVSADHDGVTHRPLTADGDDTGATFVRPWVRIGRIHVY